MTKQHAKVVIVGAGFGGLYAARTLAGKPVDVVLIDRHNYHTFTPLLYQVATSALDPADIAYPVRSIFRHDDNVNFLMGNVAAIDVDQQQVTVETRQEQQGQSYDYLVIAAGSITNFFGLDGTHPHVFELKSAQDSIDLRNHVLRLFERAAWTNDEALRQALMTITVVGGGPTGLETAGALHELYNHVLREEYPELKGITARVLLIEAGDCLLQPYPETLQRAALQQLVSLGVEVIFNNPVVAVTDEAIKLGDGREIPTHTLIWTAGVKAASLAQQLAQATQHNGRIAVKSTMEVEGMTRVYVVGDMAYLEDESGQPYPMMIPVAKQQGIRAAKNILRRENGEMEEVFIYHDRGIMATIGRRRAVAWIYNRIPLTGYLAWVAWLGLHILTLMGFRNRLAVLVSWVWNYLTYDRSVRIITK